MHKRLSKGKFRWWPSSADKSATVMQAHELQVLVWRGRSVGDTGCAGVAAGQCLSRPWCKNLRASFSG